jgi:hypothetical protein
MLSKCANPGCSAQFLYLHRGRLFRWETDSLAAGDQPGSGAEPGIKRSQRHVEFFWLCEDCARTVTLTFQNGLGITTQPLVHPEITPGREVAPLHRIPSRARAAAS